MEKQSDTLPSRRPPKRSGSSIGRRFAILCALPLVALAIGGGLYLDYRDRIEKTATQRQRAETHGRLLGLNAGLFVLSDYKERFQAELDGVSVREPEFVRCRILDVDGALLLDWSPPGFTGAFDADDVLATSSPLMFDGEPLGTIEATFSMGRVHAELTARRRALILGEIGIVAAIILLCIIEGRSITRAIDRLLETIESVADGNFGRRAPEGNDELGRLGIAFNQMAVRLDASIVSSELARAEAVKARNELELVNDELKADMELREQLEANLAQAQRLEAVGQLAAGIAHEINTPIQYIGDNMRFLEDSLHDVAGMLENYSRFTEGIGGDPELVEAVASIRALAKELDVDYLLEEIPSAISQALEGVGQVAGIVKAMKSFSHMGPDDELLLADLNEAIESTVVVARSEWKNIAELEVSLDPELPTVPCHTGLIKQVFLNLIVNAAHAIGDAAVDNKLGTIMISTSLVDGMAEVRISDSGPGIPEAIRERIFEPFFTTKEIGRGTGQGLPIAYSAVTEKHGGTLSFETAVDVGTTFIIRLPLAQDEAGVEG